jgi:hypothetical protein
MKYIFILHYFDEMFLCIKIFCSKQNEAGTKQKGTRPKKLASNRRKESLSLLKFSFLPFWLLLYRISCLLAVYFRKFTAINAIPISFSTLDFPRTENRVKRKLAFKNPKTGSTSILR